MSRSDDQPDRASSPSIRGTPPGPHGRIDDFARRLPFPLDTFQVEAIEALSHDESVLVAAPTGSGKTVVAEFACWHALETGAKCFYTTPLKALSNQKFGDLVAQHGARNVGLLTGDNSINGEASIVVMTTEVLRNMLYEGSPTLQGLRWVVLDEVHYLQDPYRGAVWEEVLIHLPQEVRVVCLSATISNVEEFGDWLRTLRGETRVVVERKRPVELRNLVVVGRELYPLLDDHGRVNADLQKLWMRGTAAAARSRGYPSGRPGGRGGAGRGGSGGRGPARARRGGGHDNPYTPTRVEVVNTLDEANMLPGIVFIFSRAGCDDAVDQCTRAGIDLTTAAESDRIKEFAELRAATIDRDDLRALRFNAFMEGLTRGIASHHAGMLPIFKETVEELFAMGLVKLVFATETLSLGINMPARTVVIERLSKFTGEKHEMLTPIDYTQLTGRAGRRGMDEVGYGVTLFNAWVRLEKIAELATQKAYTLRSSFRPSYNMAVNLVRNYDHETAAHLLNSSFAQFTSDRNVVRWERDLEQKMRELEELRSELVCDAGDVMEYWRLRKAAAENLDDRRGSSEVRAALARLVPGHVIWPERIGRAVILEQMRAGNSGAPRVTVMTADRKLRRLGPRDFKDVPEPIAQMTLRGQSWRSTKARKDIARELDRVSKGKRPERRPPAGSSKELVQAYENHPVHDCPDRDEHLKLAVKTDELGAEVSRLRRQVRKRKGTIARTFDRVLAVLQELGYVDGWTLTEKGELLRRIYNESDVLVAESLSRGWFSGLDPEELVAVASTFVYESRGRDEGIEEPPTPKLAKYERRVADLYRSLYGTEREHEIEFLKQPDAGFMGQIHEWACGHKLEDILEDRETSAGDFVRSTKQVIDLLQQLRSVAHDDLHDTIRESIERIQRGVVAYSSVV
jgi:ATP-dependent RNA helicase HelY